MRYLISVNGIVYVGPPAGDAGDVPSMMEVAAYMKECYGKQLAVFQAAKPEEVFLLGPVAVVSPRP